MVNIGCGPAEERVLLTGLHAVADIYCDCCKTTLGWKYEQAYESSQKYKEGKFIIELAHMIKENGWENESWNKHSLLKIFVRTLNWNHHKILSVTSIITILLAPIILVLRLPLKIYTILYLKCSMVSRKCLTIYNMYTSPWKNPTTRSRNKPIDGFSWFTFNFQVAVHYSNRSDMIKQGNYWL